MPCDNKKNRTAWPEVGIVVVNWNNYPDTRECLEALENRSYPTYRVIVVDNGSTDDSGKRLEKEFDWCEFVFNDRNLGFGGGCNTGIERAISGGSDYVLLLNNDAEMEPGTLRELVAVADESGASVVGAMVCDRSGCPITSGRNWYPDMLFYSGYRENLPLLSDSRAKSSDRRWWETDRIEGAGALLSREFLLDRRDSVGYFLDDSLFMYCEEVEMAMWCREYERMSVIAENATVIHEGGNSSNRAFQLYYLTRNRILIAHRYLSGLTRIVFDILYLFWRGALASRYYKRGNRNGAKAVIRGLIDGFRHIEGKGISPAE